MFLRGRGSGAGRLRSDGDSGLGGGEQFGRVVSAEGLGIADAGEGEAKVRPGGDPIARGIAVGAGGPGSVGKLDTADIGDGTALLQKSTAAGGNWRLDSATG